jgi:putative ABC transport system permease protein
VAPGNGVKSMAEYTTLMTSSNLPELKPFIRTMVGIGLVISFLVVLMNMHTMVMERTREIGILKALGSSRFDIVRLLLGETLVLALLGAVSGIAITLIVEAILKETTPTLQILITPGWLGGAVLLALAGAAAGAVYPAVRAASFDPVVALAYE